MIHIHNGDATANTAKQSSLPGEHFAFRESLITGPTPSGLAQHEWQTVRAKHLSEAYGVDVNECERSLLSQEETLASFAPHEEVVFWFEHDLFCQVHLLYLLNRCSQPNLGNTKLSLICIGEFSGKENFRGLGELNAEQLASLFPQRRRVTSEQLSLAKLAWGAYCSPNPIDIEKVLRGNTSSLPFLGAALRAQLQRFPAIRNGLGRIENRAIELIQDGSKNFIELFPKFGEAEPVYGLGDAQFWLTLKRLSTARQPLLTIDGQKSGEQVKQPLTPEVARKATFKMTELGEFVRRGEADFVALNGIDLWLGGVHLHDRKDFWRWNEPSGTLVPGQADKLAGA